MPVRRDPSADYPVRTGDGDIIVAWPHDPAWTRPERPAERDPGPDYPVFDGNGQVIIAVPYEGYGSEVEPFVPEMLDTYVVPDMPPLPPQLLLDTTFENAAMWSLHSSWAITGVPGGRALTHTAGAFGRATAAGAAFNAGSGTDYVMPYEVFDQTSASMTQGARGVVNEPGATNANRNMSTDGLYRGWISPHNVVPHLAHIYGRTLAQTQFQIDGGNVWAGSVRNPGLYDVTTIRSLPTLVLVVAGQSNAEGYGEGDVSVSLDPWHPNIWMCPPINYSYYGAKANIATVALDPLIHNGSPGQKVGPAMAMARRLVSLTGGAIRVVIVPVAKTGTTLVGTNAQWDPDTTLTGAENRLFDRAVATTNAAIAQITNHIGTMMFWSQGEADWQNYATYPAAFANFCARFKTATGITDMPVIIAGGVIADTGSPGALVTMQRTLDKASGHANSLPYVTYFDGPTGTANINVGDTVHFNTPAQRVRGDYAGQLAYNEGKNGRTWWV